MKYLLTGGHGIGDCILILPIAKAIKEYDKNAYIKVITSSNKHKVQINRDVMSLQSYVDEFDYYSVHEPLKSASFLAKTMAQRFDYGVVIQYAVTADTSSWIARIARLSCRRTCGIKNPYRSDITYSTYIEPKEIIGVKRDELYFMALRRLGINITKSENGNLLDLRRIEKYIPANQIDSKRCTIGLVIGTNAVPFNTANGFMSSFAKRWPYINWIELGKLLVQANYNVVFLGGKSEQEDLKKEGLNIQEKNMFNFVGNLNIRESIAILSLTDIVVGADTGLMHCAGALDKRSLTLFGCTDPNEYLPYGSHSEYITAHMPCAPCFGTIQSVTCPDFHCMTTITPTDVMERIKTLSKRKNNYNSNCNTTIQTL